VVVPAALEGEVVAVALTAGGGVVGGCLLPKVVVHGEDEDVDVALVVVAVVVGNTVGSVVGGGVGGGGPLL
jgi:hypothetical protein